MKHDCNVARDLMPLMLDDAASEESQKLLNEHLEECADCRAYYDGMQAALPLAHASGKREQKEFDAATRKLRKKRRLRIWRNVLIGVLAGALATAGWVRLTQVFNVPVYHGEYNVFLSQLESGQVSVNVDYQGSNKHMGVAFNKQREDGKHIFYVFNNTTVIRNLMSQPMENRSCTTLRPEDMDEFYEIREGVPSDYAVVWHTGDDIPAASSEMETYFALLDELANLDDVMTDDGEYHALFHRKNMRSEELQNQLYEVKETVPEWQ